MAREYEPSVQSIRNWVRQADLDEGRRADGLKSDEREEIRRLSREDRQLKLEREILMKSCGLVRAGVGIGATEACRFVSKHRVEYPLAVPPSGCLPQRQLRVDEPAPVGAEPSR